MSPGFKKHPKARATRGPLGSRRRRLDPDARRSELLEAAIQVLNDLGPQRARVEDVTRAARAAKGTFYLYFSSWENLLLAVRDHLIAKYTSQVRQRLDAQPEVSWETIESECVRFIKYVVDMGELHQAIFHGPAAEHLNHQERSAESVVARMIAAGVEARVCRPVDAEFAAQLVFSVLHATADSISHSGGREQKLACALDLLRRWLAAPKSEATP